MTEKACGAKEPHRDGHYCILASGHEGPHETQGRGDSFTLADIVFLEQLAASFEKITVRPKGFSHDAKERARAGTAEFQQKAQHLRAIATKIKTEKGL